MKSVNGLSKRIYTTSNMWKIISNCTSLWKARALVLSCNYIYQVIYLKCLAMKWFNEVLKDSSTNVVCLRSIVTEIEYQYPYIIFNQTILTSEQKMSFDIFIGAIWQQQNSFKLHYFQGAGKLRGRNGSICRTEPRYTLASGPSNNWTFRLI